MFYGIAFVFEIQPPPPFAGEICKCDVGWRAGSQVVDTILNKSFTWELVKIPAANCRIQKSRRKTTLFILLITFGFYYNASEMLAG